MNKKTAFVVPIYPPHYEFGKNFYNSFIDNKLDTTADFYYVFSDDEDANLFWEFEYKIILPKELLSRCKKNGSHMPDVKKFYALNYLKDKYDYLIIADAESMIVKNIDVYNVCSEYFNNKVLYWNSYVKSAKWIDFIINKSLSRIPHKYTWENINLNLWFNQPCIYKTEYLDDFFKKSKVLDDIDHLIFGEFDYYIYMFYLIFYKDFQIYDIWIEANWGFCEATNMGEINIKNENYKNCKFLACTQFVYNFLSPNNKGVFLIHHLDRKQPNIFSKIKNTIASVIMYWASKLGFNINVINKMRNIRRKYFW